MLKRKIRRAIIAAGSLLHFIWYALALIGSVCVISSCYLWIVISHVNASILVIFAAGALAFFLAHVGRKFPHAVASPHGADTKSCALDKAQFDFMCYVHDKHALRGACTVDDALRIFGMMLVRGMIRDGYVELSHAGTLIWTRLGSDTMGHERMLTRRINRAELRIDNDKTF